ncbi:MAG: hypothetical protein HOO86_03315 [Bacteroidales bacterium]|nr:hypothetical protein [Bacteroidales bacterium]
MVNDFQDKILQEERLEKARKSYEIGRWIDQLANRRFESTPKSQILPPNHKNTKFHQRENTDCEYLVHFGGLQFWWHFFFYQFLEWIQDLED